MKSKNTARPLFDFPAYLSQLCRTNRLAAAEGFQAGTCTGLEGMEDLLAHYSTAPALLLTDDVVTGETYQTAGGWFARRTFTVFLLRSYAYGNEPERIAALSLCRELRRQLQSRLLHDAHSFALKDIYIGLENMASTELGKHFAHGMTGLYFLVNVDEPLNLSYHAADWTE